MLEKGGKCRKGGGCKNECWKRRENVEKEVVVKINVGKGGCENKCCHTCMPRGLNGRI